MQTSAQTILLTTIAMLTFAANLTEEIPYMTARIRNGWQYLALFLTIFHFAVPWSRCCLDPAHLHRLARILLFMRYADLFMMISGVLRDGRTHLEAGEYAESVACTG
jgi:hypothetical protein